MDSVYTVEYVKRTNSYNVLRNGTYVICTESTLENAIAVAEECQYEADCHEWAINNNQESEFDYV